VFRILVPVLVFFLTSTSIAQPSKPRTNLEALQETRALVRQAAYASFIASSCELRDEFRERANRLVQANSKYENVATDYLEKNSKLFDEQRNEHASKSNWWSVFKRCSLEKGKTRVFLDSVTAKADARIAALEKPLEDWRVAVDSYQREQDRLKAEREAQERARLAQEENDKRERIARQARQIVEESAQYIIDNTYQGGRDLIKRVVEHEYHEPSQTYRVKVEMEWRGKASGNSGYGAIGVIEATYKDHNGRWRLNDNLKWQPAWVSPALDRFLKCRTSIFSLIDCM
jgi:hypothetical protein